MSHYRNGNDPTTISTTHMSDGQNKTRNRIFGCVRYGQEGTVGMHHHMYRNPYESVVTMP